MFVCLGDTDYELFGNGVFDRRRRIRVLNTDTGVVSVSRIEEFLCRGILIPNLRECNVKGIFQFEQYNGYLRVCNKSHSVHWSGHEIFIDNMDTGISFHGNTLYMFKTKVGCMETGNPELYSRVMECKLFGSVVLSDVVIGWLNDHSGRGFTYVHVVCALDMKSYDYGVYDYKVNSVGANIHFKVLKGINRQIAAKLKTLG